MPEVKLCVYSSNASYLGEKDFPDPIIPRVGETLYFPKSTDNGMDWYIVQNIEYHVIDHKTTVYVDIRSVAAEPPRMTEAQKADAINEARYEIMQEKGWVNLELQSVPE